MINFLNKECSPKGKCIKRPYLCSFPHHTNLRLFIFIFCVLMRLLYPNSHKQQYYCCHWHCYLVLLLTSCNSLVGCLIMWLHRAAKWSMKQRSSCRMLQLVVSVSQRIYTDMRFSSSPTFPQPSTSIFSRPPPSLSTSPNNMRSRCGLRHHIHLFPTLAPPTQSNKSIFVPPSPSTSFRSFLMNRTFQPLPFSLGLCVHTSVLLIGYSLQSALSSSVFPLLAVFVHLRRYVNTVLKSSPLLNIQHYMFRPNWPSSRV
jgi:hypothetical protein